MSQVTLEAILAEIKRLEMSQNKRFDTLESRFDKLEPKVDVIREQTADLVVRVTKIERRTEGPSA
jgi:chaperonin cofactor prefoldin